MIYTVFRIIKGDDLMSDKISYEDIKPYEELFTATPAFLLERFAKRNTNFVSKFKSKVQSFLDGLNDDQKKKLDIVLNSDTEELQAVMAEAYEKTNIKQYKILANPKYKEFIQININEIENMIA